MGSELDTKRMFSLIFFLATGLSRLLSLNQMIHLPNKLWLVHSRLIYRCVISSIKCHKKEREREREGGGGGGKERWRKGKKKIRSSTSQVGHSF